RDTVGWTERTYPGIVGALRGVPTSAARQHTIETCQRAERAWRPSGRSGLPLKARVFSRLCGADRPGFESALLNRGLTEELLRKRLFVSAGDLGRDGSLGGDAGIRAWLNSVIEAFGHTVEAICG